MCRSSLDGPLLAVNRLARLLLVLVTDFLTTRLPRLAGAPVVVLVVVLALAVVEVVVVVLVVAAVSLLVAETVELARLPTVGGRFLASPSPIWSATESLIGFVLLLKMV